MPPLSTRTLSHTPALAPAAAAIVVISPDGRMPPSHTSYVPRLITPDPAAVRESDDIVIVFAPSPSSQVAALRGVLADRCPKMLAVARRWDAADVDAAFDLGVTSYLIIDRLTRYCLVEIVGRTIAGESCLSPEAATVLVRRLQGSGQPPAATGDTPAPPPEPVDICTELTPRERQMLDLLVLGHSVAEIAERLKLARKTVRNNLSCAYGKLHVRGQSEAILRWLGRHHAPQAFDNPASVGNA